MCAVNVQFVMNFRLSNCSPIKPQSSEADVAQYRKLFRRPTVAKTQIKDNLQI